MSTLTPEQIEARIAGGPWRLQDGALVRDLELPDFGAVIALLNRIADAAEAANHHPDMLVHGWNGLRLTLSTHSAGGVTDAYLALADAIDALVPATGG